MNEVVTIERMAYGPQAIAHTANGKAVFVANAAPEDVVEIAIDEDKGSFAKAHVVRLVEPSPWRVGETCSGSSPLRAKESLPCPLAVLHFGENGTAESREMERPAASKSSAFHGEKSTSATSRGMVGKSASAASCGAVGQSQLRAEGVLRASCEDVRFCQPACGGCPWAHLTYEAQVAAKGSIVRDALIRTAHFDPEAAAALVEPCIPSPRQWGYRNKLELAAVNEKGGLKLGFFREGTHDLATPTLCPLVHKNIQKAPKALGGALRYLQGKTDLGLFRVGVRSSLNLPDVEIALWTKPGSFPRKAAASVLESTLSSTSIVRVMADEGKSRKVKGVEVLAGRGFWREVLAGRQLGVSAPSFFQVNTTQAEQLIRLALDMLSIDEFCNVADLYCGVGTFTLPMAGTGAFVLGVEAEGSSIRDLRRNASHYHFDIEVIGGDVARELPALGGLDAMLVDPPRAGLAKEVVESMASAGPKHIVYISCDPQTWARDILRFDDRGFHLKKAVPVDLFPQTYHVETVSLLERD